MHTKRTSLNLDLDLVSEAKRALGTVTTTETIHQALRDSVRRERLRRLAARRFEDLESTALEDLRRARSES
jgi:Arc/MetJ family transcription regulator